MIKNNKKKLFTLVFLFFLFFFVLSQVRTFADFTDPPPTPNLTPTQTSTPNPTRTSTKPPTPNPTRNPQICTPEQTQCVSTSECASGCKACSKDGTSWFCTNSDWCNWCKSLQNTRTPTRRPNRPPTQTLTPTVSCSTHTKGDANCDGKIDGIDYSMWLNRQCTTGCSRENLKADFNNDGKVNDDDYSIWFSNRV